MRAKPTLYLSTMGSLKDSLLDNASSSDYSGVLGLYKNPQYSTIVSDYFDNYYKTSHIQLQRQYSSMDLQGLVVSKGLKGKQNKKKWNKNIDVSGLLDSIQKSEKEQLVKKYAKPLIVEDTTNKDREDLDPNRFKNRPKSQPKPIYDNSYKRANLIEDEMQDAWGTPVTAVPKKQQQLIVPAIIKPSSGHSYNPTKEHVEKIIDEVIEYEKPLPKKQKKIKKIKEVKVVPRTRNKKLRQEYLLARQRKMERENLNKINSLKKVKKQLQEKERMIQQKIEKKQQQKQKRLKQAKTGKVREGPKLGKKRYEYKQYIPNEQQIGKKMSHVGLSDQLMKEQYDSIFRRGIMEPRNIKVHANKTKGLKVTEKFEDD